jgi:hypothetical protein
MVSLSLSKSFKVAASTLQIDAKTQEVLEKVDQINLDHVSYHLMTPNESNINPLSQEETETAIAAYRQFLAIRILYPNEPIVPSTIVDKVWHSHILSNTRKYSRDCDFLFGTFFHHQSHGHLTPEDQAYRLIKQNNTSRLLTLHFGDMAWTYGADCGPCCTIENCL